MLLRSISANEMDCPEILRRQELIFSVNEGDY